MSTEELGPRQRAAATKRKRSISRITAAALALFDAHGWYGADYDDIAKESGVSSATIANHFPNKQAIALGAYASVLLPIVNRAETALVNGTEVGDVVTKFIHELAVTVAGSPALAAALQPAIRDTRPTKMVAKSDETSVVDFDQLADLLGRLLEECWKSSASTAGSASDVAEFCLLGLLSRIVKHPEQSGDTSAEIMLTHLL